MGGREAEKESKKPPNLREINLTIQHSEEEPIHKVRS